jgi:hypothetical protein
VSAFLNDATPANHWMRAIWAPDLQCCQSYHNKGEMNFEEVGFAGIKRSCVFHGMNFGDIIPMDFDFYLGTGNPLYQSLVPNKMYLNMEGQRFEDVL